MTLPSETGRTYGQHASHRVELPGRAPTPYPDDLARRLAVATGDDANETVQTPPPPRTDTLPNGDTPA